MINNEIAEITAKIAALDVIRNNLEQDLMRLDESELELEEECMTCVLLVSFIGSFLRSIRCPGTSIS